MKFLDIQQGSYLFQNKTYVSIHLARPPPTRRHIYTKTHRYRGLRTCSCMTPTNTQTYIPRHIYTKAHIYRGLGTCGCMCHMLLVGQAALVLQLGRRFWERRVCPVVEASQSIQFSRVRNFIDIILFGVLRKKFYLNVARGEKLRPPPTPSLAASTRVRQIE